MKVTRMIISTVLVALASSSSAQLGTIKDFLFPERPESHQVAYTSDSGSDYYWESGTDGRITRISPHQAELPSVFRASREGNAEVIYEAGEVWTEEAVVLESWMTLPFDTEYIEEELLIEPWMTEPFETECLEDDLKLESWMTIPFGGPVSGDLLCLEDWMTRPFEVQPSMGIESWMLASIGK